MSKVVRFYQTGKADVLKVEDRSPPEPQAGEVLVKIRASTLNRAEIMYREGGYLYQPQFPSTIGLEAVGIVEKIGSGVSTSSGSLSLTFSI